MKSLVNYQEIEKAYNRISNYATKTPLLSSDLLNKEYSENWHDNLEKYRLEKSIGWKIAIIKDLGQFSANIELEDKTLGKINYQSITWTKKEFNEILNIGDIIYVKKNLNDN